MKDKWPKKVFEYHDVLNDDFAGTNIKQKPISPNYKYVHKNPFWRFFAFLFYWCIAVPFLGLVARLHFLIKIKGKKNLRKLRHQGYFIYANHTQDMDAFIPQTVVCWRKRTAIIVNPDATSLKGVRHLVSMLGGLPIPTLEKKEDFLTAIDHYLYKKRVIIVYPEAHIWPYATYIRPFKEDAFIYPAKILSPVVPMVSTYVRRKGLFKNCHPKMVIHIGKPIYPNANQSLQERKLALREATYNFMVEYAHDGSNAEYYQYKRGTN